MSTPTSVDPTGKTTTAAARSLTRTAGDSADTSLLLSRRQWIAVAWGAFTTAAMVALAATGRFMFPSVLDEPPRQFKAGFPNEHGMGVDERWKDKFGVWIVRTPEDVVQHATGLYALIAVCTHLGCTPNFIAAEQKFKGPCHGSGFHLTGMNLS